MLSIAGRGRVVRIAALTTYDPPGGLPDFLKIPGQLEHWSAAVSRWFDESAPSGHDMVVGQNGAPGQARERRCVVFGAGQQPTTISTREDFVIPTGGGYFFSPSISALRDSLAV